jgi:prepilin-type N-terminal cleavage/methylation domain-containing protein
MSAIRPTRRRGAFTLIELLVVIAIIITLAALAAGFMPNISESQNLTRSVDQLEQWLLTARMRAKRDGLATGLRFTPDPSNPGMFSEMQYIQQPDPLSGGTAIAGGYQGGVCISSAPPNTGLITFANVDFTNGQPGLFAEYLVQAGDYLELYNGGGVHLIMSVPSPTMLQLNPLSAYDTTLTISVPTTNYRILRQPRLLVGESPLQLPNNFVVDGANTVVTLPNGTMTPAPPTPPATPLTNIPFRPVAGAPNGGYFEILFSPSGAVIGPGASSGKIYFFVRDFTQGDATKSGIVAVQTRTGFIGAYNISPGNDPLYFAEEGRSSGL